MKIGVSTLALYPQELMLVLDELSNLGVDYCEIINEYPYHDVESSLLDSYNLGTTIHAPLSDINLSSPNIAIRRTSIAQIKKSIDLAVEIGSHLVVVHPGQLPILRRNLEPKIYEYNLKSLKECSEYAQECGVTMAVENMPNIEGLLFQDLDELEQLVNEINAQITLDVGHAHNNNYSPMEMIQSKKICHIHLSDNDGSFDNHQALGSSTIDFQTILNGLKQVNYQGVLVVEVKNKEDVAPSIEYLKKLI